MANLFCNLYANIFGKSEPSANGRILILGLTGGVGKTTVWGWLKFGEPLNTIPTHGFNMETIEHNNKSFEVFDIGGGDKMIPFVWKHFFKHTKGIIFVIDSTDNDSRYNRLGAVEQELNKLLNDKEIEHCPFLLLANKQDLPEAVSVDDLKKALKLDQWTNRKIHVLSAVAKQGTGVNEGFDWLCSEISKLQ